MNNDTPKGLKPFNLEAAKKGAPVCTRNGVTVRIVDDKCKQSGFPIIAVLGQFEETIIRYTKDGRNSPYDNHTHDKDLDIFMAPVKHEKWVNIYPSSFKGHQPFRTDEIFTTKEDALKNAHGLIIATTKIEWETPYSNPLI